jgi:exopolysaccharide biosynthesis polyprenyl glycosylphosphotransferase
MRLLITDAAAIVIVLGATWVAGFAVSEPVVSWDGGPRIPYWAFFIALGIAWFVMLDFTDSRTDRVVGHGAAEYRRVVDSTLMVFVVVLTIAFFFRIDLARSTFWFVLPVGLLTLLFSRWLWRQWLRAQQAKNHYVHRAIVVGDYAKAEHVIRTMRNSVGLGMDIVGVVLGGAPGERAREVASVPVLGGVDDVIATVDATDADTVVFTGSDHIDPDGLRRLGWDLADRDIRLIVAPALTDVAGPRIHARPVAGLPLVHVSFPTMDGGRRALKRSFDIVVSGAILLVLLPVLIVISILVKTSGPGPILYQQERIGRYSRPFGMLKFRSMVADADDQLATLLDMQGTSDQPLFKVTDDPRITRVGRTLRKYSLDEFPQLLNVLKGDMSLVGPRPQRPAEVAMYDDSAHRRLLVKPGMSGLWQVSGRSALSWEDALRLDLYYVENWSFTQDIIILFRTVKAVVAPGNSAH